MNDIFGMAMRINLDLSEVIGLLLGGVMAYWFIIIAQKIRDWRRR